jgi:hypothetical protein
MEKSKASWELRGALKRRTRKFRRRKVIGFYCMMVLWPLVTLGNDHHGFQHFFWAAFAPFIVILELPQWRRKQRLVVTGLDDRAQLQYGVNFDQLSDAEQKEILQQYRVGRYLVDPGWVLDERQEMSRLRANETAFRFLRVALACIAAAYWMVYLWMPAGDWRDTLMDSPVVISWLAAFVISLPEQIEMWTEPDDVAEPRAVISPAHST